MELIVSVRAGLFSPARKAQINGSPAQAREEIFDLNSEYFLSSERLGAEIRKIHKNQRGQEMHRCLVLLTLFGSLALAGCGMVVPQIRDFPNNYNSAKNNELVHAIIESVHCELEDAVTRVINAGADAKFLKDWGAEVALTLNLEESSTISPSTVYLPNATVTQTFTLAGGLSAKADATRVDKVNSYYPVSELYLGRNGKCPRPNNSPPDSLLIQSDLKLGEWLSAMVTGVATGQITHIGNKNVISHQITFELTTTGDITPAWVLTRATINKSGKLFTTSRARKHDLLVTFGPADPSKKRLIPAAETAHFASLLTSGVTTGFKNALNQ